MHINHQICTVITLTHDYPCHPPRPLSVAAAWRGAAAAGAYAAVEMLLLRPALFVPLWALPSLFGWLGRAVEEEETTPKAASWSALTCHAAALN